METKRYPISANILQTYTGAGFALIGVSVLSILFTVILLCSLGSMSGDSGGSHHTTVRVRSGGTGGGGGLLMLLGMLGVGICAGWGARVPFRRAAEARGSYIELDGERFLWVKTSSEQVTIPWREVKDVYSTDTTLHIAGGTKAEVPAEFEDFEDLVATVKARSGRG